MKPFCSIKMVRSCVYLRDKARTMFFLVQVISCLVFLVAIYKCWAVINRRGRPENQIDSGWVCFIMNRIHESNLLAPGRANKATGQKLPERQTVEKKMVNSSPSLGSPFPGVESEMDWDVVRTCKSPLSSLLCRPEFICHCTDVMSIVNKWGQ